jgi:hypothetical protein
MSISFVVYAAIPDRWILHTQEVAEALCAHNGGTCDWEFYDSERVKYWFTDAGAAEAFKGHCALMDWRME